MEKLTALVLSLVMTLSVAGVGDQDNSFLRQLLGSWGRIFTAVQENTVNVAELRTGSIAVLLEDSDFYSAPTRNGRVMTQMKRGDKFAVIRMEQIGSASWAYVRSDLLNTAGWLPAELLLVPNLPDTASTAPTTPPTVPPTTVETIPYYAKPGVVTSERLNIRKAPGVDQELLGSYYYGDRVGILETREDWGRTNRGWIYLGYVYLDGNLGEHHTSGMVTADQLNIRSGPGVKYPATGRYYRNDRVDVLEQVLVGSQYWGYTPRGWICMSYVMTDFIPGTTIPIYGFGYVHPELMNIYAGAGESFPVLGQYKRGENVPIYIAVEANGEQWGQTALGWVSLKYMTITLIAEPEPTKPTEPTDPTETTAPEDPTDPDETTEPEETTGETSPTEEEDTTETTAPTETIETTAPTETTTETTPDETTAATEESAES